ncbi:MAG TPA: BON domain-containing protein [Longimicrobium sp.]|uniref:BON domain-containing protein n=1 Tax=Longimicrobium sp. TaxID=2029185 RepID=UPI002EDB7252
MAEQKSKRPNREYVVELEEPSSSRGLVYALGALGGLVIAGFLARGAGAEMVAEVGQRLRDRARPAPWDEGGDEAPQPALGSPGRLRRDPEEDSALMELEDEVLDAFLDDEVLSARGIDVGAISHGIVELSGEVWTREDARRAVAVAQSVRGVETVINRMEIGEERSRLHGRESAGYAFYEDGEMSGSEWSGGHSGMGGRRQGRETDPDRSDDSQHMREVEIEKADRAQFADEGYHNRPRNAERDEVQEANRTNFSEDELDNQSPYGKHAIPVPEQPQAMNSQSRVGEGMKPGVELRLEQADVPVKPHQRQPGDEDRGV